MILEFNKVKTKIAKIVIKRKHIFREPDLDDDPLIFWVWHKRLNSGNTFYAAPKNVITMNLHMLRKMHDCPEDIEGVCHFMSAVLVEELTHCATRSMKNHENWMRYLKCLNK